MAFVLFQLGTALSVPKATCPMRKPGEGKKEEKKMKKILVMILAVMMSLSLFFSAFASETEVSLDDMAVSFVSMY